MWYRWYALGHLKCRKSIACVSVSSLPHNNPVDTFFLVVLQYFHQDASTLCQLTDCTHWSCKSTDNSVFANLSKNIDLIWSCWWRQDGGWWCGVGDAHSSISLHRPSSGNIQSGNWAASFHWVYCKHWTFLKAQAPHTLVWRGLDVILALSS